MITRMVFWLCGKLLDWRRPYRGYELREITWEPVGQVDGGYPGAYTRKVIIGYNGSSYRRSGTGGGFRLLESHE